MGDLHGVRIVELVGYKGDVQRIHSIGPLRLLHIFAIVISERVFRFVENEPSPLESLVLFSTLPQESFLPSALVGPRCWTQRTLDELLPLILSPNPLVQQDAYHLLVFAGRLSIVGRHEVFVSVLCESVAFRFQFLQFLLRPVVSHEWLH